MSKRGGSKRGAISGKPPEGVPWVWLTQEMMQTATYLALSSTALRILTILLLEHMSHGGKENGRLSATHRQLDALGVSKHEIQKGFEELQVCGFIRLTRQGLRGHAGAEPSRYAVTWLVTFLNTPQAAIPTDDWREVAKQQIKAGRVTVRQVRSWLKAQVADKVPEWRRSPKSAAGSQDIEGAPQKQGGLRGQTWGATPAEVIPIAPHLGGGSGTNVGLRK